MTSNRERCTAKKKSDGTPCRRFPINGGRVCYNHGGAAPQVKARAAAQHVEDLARDAVSKMNIVPVDNPLTMLGRVAGEMVAVKDRLALIVVGLEDRQLRSTDEKGAEQIRGELSAYMTLLNSTVGALATIAKLNIDERLARITEVQRATILRALEAALASVGVQGEEAQRAKAVAGRHLRVVGS